MRKRREGVVLFLYQDPCADQGYTHSCAPNGRWSSENSEFTMELGSARIFSDAQGISMTSDIGRGGCRIPASL